MEQNNVNENSIPKSSIDATYQGDRLDVLEKKTEDIKDSISKSEKRINQTTNFLVFVASAVIITFFFASIPIFYSYYEDNYGRYEKYLKDVDELKIRMEIIEKRNDLMWENQIKK